MTNEESYENKVLDYDEKNEAAYHDLVKIARSVGMEITNETAISTMFCVNVMRRLEETYSQKCKALRCNIDTLEKRIKQIEQEPCKETIKEDVWKFAIHCMELGYGVNILKQYTASEAMAKLEKFKKLEQIAPCGDAISRQWIKTAIHNFYDGLMHTPTEEDIQAYISAAPPVQPKVVPIAEIRFDDDKLHEIVDEAIKDIEITPLKKIRAEIEQKARPSEIGGRQNGKSIRYGLCMASEIIDKYMAESEDNNDNP